MRGKRVFYRVQAGLLSGLLLATMLTHPAVAADDIIESITLSPVSKDYSVKAGGEKRDTLTVINDGKEPYNLIVYARPYSVAKGDTSYEPNFTSEAQNADAYRWVQFDKPSYRVQPGQSLKIGYTLRVPKDATPGGHYGVLFAETQPESKLNGSSVQRKKRVGAILYITVDGKFTISGSVDKSSVAFFQSKAPLDAYQQVTNSGNTHFVATTSMKVSDIFGGQKFTTERSYPVLPKTSRKALVQWPSPAWLGIYKVELTTKLLDSSKSSSHYVLVAPPWVYILIALVIGARVLYALARRKR